MHIVRWHFLVIVQFIVHSCYHIADFPSVDTTVVLLIPVEVG